MADEESKKEAINKLTKISEVGEKRAEKLYEHGLHSPEEIVEKGLAGLAEVSDMGFQTSKNILENAKKVVDGEEEISDEGVEGIVGEMEELERSLDEDEEEGEGEGEEEEESDDISDEDMEGLVGEMEELERSLDEEEEEAEEEEESEDREEDMPDEVEAIEELRDDFEEGEEEVEDEVSAVEPEVVEESSEVGVDEAGDMEDELGSLLDTIGGTTEEVGPDFEIAKEIDEWIEDTVGIEAHVGEESKCSICGEIVSIHQSRCDRCGVEFIEGVMECEECGVEVDPESVRCPECEAALVDEKTKCPICESIVFASEDTCTVCGTEFYEDQIRCDDCKSTVPIDAIVCPHCDAILRQKIMQEHMESKMEVTTEKTEIDIGGMNIQMQGGPSPSAEDSAELSDFGGNHSTSSGRVLFPFPAVVNQKEMKTALLLNAVNQDIGGVLIEGHRGTAKSVAIRGLSEILPEIEVIEGCRFSCDPNNRDEWCWECEEKYAEVHPEEIPIESRPVNVIDLPLNATEDRVVGTLDVEKMIQEGVKAFQEGILAEVNRGILYVDEINLLDDFIVDVLLDAAAMGRVTVEREDISVTYPSNFILVGSMNPEEGALRPQLLDRLALNVKVEGIDDSKERRKIIDRRESFNEDPHAFREEWEDEIEDLRIKVEEAKERLGEVHIPDRMDDVVTRVAVDFEVDGHRADIIMRRAAKTHAAFEGRTEVNRDDVTLAARMALPHRMKKGPLEEQEFSVERLKRLVRQYS